MNAEQRQKDFEEQQRKVRSDWDMTDAVAAYFKAVTETVEEESKRANAEYWGDMS